MYPIQISKSDFFYTPFLQKSSRNQGCYNECSWGHVAMCSSCSEAVSEWMPPVHGSWSRLPHSKGKHTGIECSQQKSWYYISFEEKRKSWCISTTGLISAHPCKVWAWWTVLTRPATTNIINTGVTGNIERGETGETGFSSLSHVK